MTATRNATGLEIGGEGRNVERSHCARCGAPLQCGMNGPAPCWCAAYPRVMPVPDAGSGCYCPACLGELTAKQLRKGGAAPA